MITNGLIMSNKHFIESSDEVDLLSNTNENGAVNVSEKHILEEQDTSVSIEYSDSDLCSNSGSGSIYPDILGSIHNKGPYKSEKEFQNQINALKVESSERFRNSWSKILEKYSSIDDEKESDEIDLSEGKIIVDNGHLRSMGMVSGSSISFSNDIWSLSNDLERKFRNEELKAIRNKFKKKELRDKLKASELFHNPNTSSEHTGSLSSSPFSTNKYIDEDNLLDLTPSPTKRMRSSPVHGIGSSPWKNDHSYLGTPTKQNSPSPFKSIKKKNSPVSKFLDSIYSQASESTLKRLDKGNIINGRIFSLENSSSDKTKLPNRKESIMSKIEDLNMSTLTSDLGNKLSKNVFFIKSFDSKDRESSTNRIYGCAFNNCKYCTGNKTLYSKHLLSVHIKQLRSIGFPVQTKETVNVTAEEKEKLLSVFPLVYPVPSLPLSEDSMPYRCSKKVANSSCTKIFLTEETLKHHEDLAPHDCTDKTIIFACPMLGCSYMTETFFDWRNHFIKEKHHIHPSCLTSAQSTSKTIHSSTDQSRLKYLNSAKKFSSSAMSYTELEKELSDIFSDNDDNTGEAGIKGIKNLNFYRSKSVSSDSMLNSLTERDTSRESRTANLSLTIAGNNSESCILEGNEKGDSIGEFFRDKHNS